MQEEIYRVGNFQVPLAEAGHHSAKRFQGYRSQELRDQHMWLSRNRHHRIQPLGNNRRDVGPLHRNDDPVFISGQDV